MERRAVKIDRVSVERATTFARSWRDDALKKAGKLELDTEAPERIKQQLCQTCYYLKKGGIAGQAITMQPCGVCNENQTYSSTATDVLCMGCARVYELCKKCGADIHLKNRRDGLPETES